MKINTLITPSHVDELYFTGKTVVVIDVLRASSTIVTALKGGAREVIPVRSIEFGIKAGADMFGGKTLRGGERNMKKIDGFNLGNSPLEYTEEAVGDKAIILLTTNGSKAIAKTKFSDESFICSYLNISAVTEKLGELNNDCEIVCSGNSGGFSLEDTVCAGSLIEGIMKQVASVELSDSSKAALELSEKFGGDIHKLLSETEHGRLLIENGYAEDIDFCSQKDKFEIVPLFSSNTIKLPK